MVTTTPTEDSQFATICASISGAHDEEKVYNGLALLERLAGNISKNPTEQKYRSFKKSNAKISADMLSLGDSVTDLILAMGFTHSADGERFEFTGNDFKTLRLGLKAIEDTIEPVKLRKMTKEERDKYMLLKQKAAEYKASQQKQQQIKDEAERMSRFDRMEKATEESKPSVQNHLSFGANLVQFKPPAGGR